MTSLFPQLSFEHQEPLGRPSCPKCGKLCLFPERIEYASARVWNDWRCDSCTLRFQTSVAMTPDTQQQPAAA